MIAALLVVYTHRLSAILGEDGCSLLQMHTKEYAYLQ
jgi:hypothetical protein